MMGRDYTENEEWVRKRVLMSGITGCAKSDDMCAVVLIYNYNNWMNNTAVVKSDEGKGEMWRNLERDKLISVLLFGLR